MLSDVHAWTQQFWTTLREIEPAWCVSGLTASLADDRIIVDPHDGRAGTMYIVHGTGASSSTWCLPYDLDESPTVNAQYVALRCRRLQHAAGVLDRMRKDDLLRSLAVAREDEGLPDASRGELAAWCERLAPIFDEDPSLTVADALELYRRGRK